MKLQVIYCRRRTLGSWLLRFFMWSSWSHCGIVTPEDTVIEALAWKGVVETPFAEFSERISKYDVKFIEVPDAAAGIAWARSQVGQRYDWWSVIGLGLRREWGRPNDWNCGELCEGAVERSGRTRFDRTPRRITPQISYMVA